MCVAVQSVARVVGTFHAWDVDCSGGLTLDEFSAINGAGTLSTLVLQRVFQVRLPSSTSTNIGSYWPAVACCCRDDTATLTSSPCSTPALALCMQPLQTTSLIPLLSTMPTYVLRPQEHVAKKREAGGLMADEMSLLEFVDFVLAWDCRANPATIPYFFAIFDLQKQVRQHCSPACFSPHNPA